MQYRTLIDNVAAKKWGLSISQAYILDWLIQFQLKAEKLTIDGSIYFFASRNKAVKELPLLTEKADTIYRYYKQLEDFGLISLKKIDNKDYISIMPKCSNAWGQVKDEEFDSDSNPSIGKKSDNSDSNPKELGFKSENSSDSNPTNNTIITNQTIIDKTTNTGGFENFQQEEIPPPMPKTILSELLNYWLQVNPEYKKIATPKVDNPAIRQIAEIITKNKMFHTDPEKTMKMWRAFCQVILNNDFYKNKPLKTICNNIQTFLSDVQAAANGQYVPPKNKNGSAAVQLVPQKINLDQKPQILLNGGAPIRL